ncbi:MAG: YIP1 family protein [Rhodobacteraceae bacterium]|nr:YIP1 family protein [Paracoccaceae bacterium]
MTVTSDITATYRGPGKVMTRLLKMGQREDRVLIFLMAGCIVIFIAQLPPLARKAHLTGQELNMLLGGALLAWVTIAPLLLYGIATLTHLIARAIGGKGSWYGARLSLFWSLLASSPLLLLHGLIAGFIGPGPALWGVEVLWFCIFGWFWLATLRRAERTPG